jgi:peptidoglycan/LPS O-acetylase OafA/YrhL
MGKSVKYDPLSVVRSLACLVIVWTHIFVRGPLASVHGIDLSFLFHPCSTAAVFVFFLLSGYGAGYGFATGKYKLTGISVGRYYLNRILRIVPLYYACVLISVLIIYRTVPIQAKYIIQFFTFTATDSISLPFMGPLAIISTEMQFYLVAPLLYFGLKQIIKRIGMPAAAVFILLLGFLIRLYLLKYFIGDNQNTWISLVYTTVWGNLDIFLSGMLLSLTVVHPSQTVLKLNKIIFQVAFPLLFAIWYIWSSRIAVTMNQDGWFGLIKYQLLFILPSVTSLLTGWYIFSTVTYGQWKPMSIRRPAELLQAIFHPGQYFEVLAILSFGLYIWHWPIEDYLFYRSHLPGNLLQAGIQFLIVFGLAISASVMTYFLIELPFLKLKYKPAAVKTSGSP